MKLGKPPQLLSDVYRDLRDRRLLIPIGALLVALIAVPLVLGGGGEEAAPPPATAAVPTDEAAAVQSAVLVEEVGIRDYRKRLDELKQKNPFDQKFTLPPPSAGGVGGVGGVGGAGGAIPSTPSAPIAPSPSPAPSSPIGSTTDTFDETVDSTSIDETTVNETTIHETTVNEEPTQPPEIHFYAGRIDVVIGPLGKAQEKRGVRYLDLLPSDKSPVVAFLGLGEAADKAVFSVSSDVIETDGQGHCAPKRPRPCQFLTLRTGEQRMLKLANGKTFRLKLLDTQVVRVPDPREDGKGDGDGDDG